MVHKYIYICTIDVYHGTIYVVYMAFTSFRIAFSIDASAQDLRRSQHQTWRKENDWPLKKKKRGWKSITVL